MERIIDRRPKLRSNHKELIFKCLGEFMTLQAAADKVKEVFGIEITEQAVDHYKKKYPEKVTAAREEYGRDLLRFPIANKVWRLEKLQKIFNEATDYKTILKALAQARIEIGEDVEKLSEAIRNSGGRTFNFDLGKLPEGDRENIRDQFGAFFAGETESSGRIDLSRMP